MRVFLQNYQSMTLIHLILHPKPHLNHFVRAFGDTYDLPIIISNCSNNYGPFQYPEKLIPLFIHNIVNNKNLPIYGDGNIRDWLYVEDHVSAIKNYFGKGKIGQTYNIGGFNEWKILNWLRSLSKLLTVC